MQKDVKFFNKTPFELRWITLNYIQEIRIETELGVSLKIHKIIEKTEN